MSEIANLVLGGMSIAWGAAAVYKYHKGDDWQYFMMWALLTAVWAM